MAKRKKWTKESVLAEARHFSSKIQWKEASPSSYKKARIAGWLDEASAHMEPLWEKKWDEEKVTEVAKQYPTQKDWVKNSPSSYAAAVRMSIVGHATTHMTKLTQRNKWTHDTVAVEMNRHRSRAEWAKKSPGSYEAAKRLGIEPVQPKLWDKKWNKESILENAKGYQNIAGWINENQGAYKAAVSLGVVEEATAHMKVLGGRSTSEDDMMTMIRSKFPKAQKISMSNKDERFVAQRFHLDVYVPDLKKGVEFDGDYWHSPKGLKRGRPSWTDEQIENYHELKDAFFRSRNIEVLHVKEQDWLSDKDRCIDEIFKFLTIGE